MNMGRRKQKFLLFDVIWHKAIRELPEYQRLEMYEAIFEYAFSGRFPEGLTGANLSLLMVICDSITEIPTEDCGTEDQEGSDME